MVTPPPTRRVLAGDAVLEAVLDDVEEDEGVGDGVTIVTDGVLDTLGVVDWLDDTVGVDV